MNALVKKVVLERIGSAQATVGMVSLPLPREVAGEIGIDHPCSAMHGVAWWERHKVARRALAFVVDNAGVPPTLGLKQKKKDTCQGGCASCGCESEQPWQLRTRITREKLDYTPHKFADIASLRGVPTHECTTIEYELELEYQGRKLILQMGATEKDGKSGPHYWQNVQIDPLWSNPAVQALRVGGIVYNGDTYLWADVYLLLFANGVAHAAVHFLTTKLHIEGYDFVGLPLMRMAGDLKPRNATLPADGLRFDLGGMKLNLEDAGQLCSSEHPGGLEAVGKEMFYRPFSRTFNPQKADAGECEWAPGMARTVRFQFSLSDAPPLIARYRVPSWWYAAAGEPWPGGYLPARGRYDAISTLHTQHIRKTMVRGRFDACSGEMANDGYAGSGMMRNFYMTGEEGVFQDALDYCYFWADWAVDHRDYSVHQWIGGWGWKTCAYSKFRDVLTGYLETGDPYLQDTVEMAAEQYWMWFRSNWPRCTIGRDSFEVSGWAWLWRFFRTEHARERTRELVRMLETVLTTRGVIGGQMGAGPHPGYLSSLYMSGVCMVSLLEAAEAEQEEGNHERVEHILQVLKKAHMQFNRDDVELFPSSYTPGKKDWHAYKSACWAILALRIYPELARLQGEDEATDLGLARSVSDVLPPLKDWLGNRPGDNLLQSWYHDAMMLGAVADDKGLSIAPIGKPEQWPPQWVLSTPWGELKIGVERQAGLTRLNFQAAKEFPIALSYGGQRFKATSMQSVALEGKNRKKKAKV